MQPTQTECNQCGTCCANGGPALHRDDKKLIEAGTIPISHLITIRKNELVHHPITGKVQPVKNELIKISGIGKKWSCYFFDPDLKSCTIYDTRPKSCRELECWNTEAIEKIIEKDLLNRAELIDADNPLYRAVVEHEETFPCPDLESLLEKGSGGDNDNLEGLANDEVTFRSEQVSRHDLSLGEELFYFGRPLFHLLMSVGAVVREADGRLIIGWPRK
jgi:Fe-S-cluster containining protein